MTRTLYAELDLHAEGAARAVLAITAATGYEVDEQLTVTQAGSVLPITEIADLHGTRLHVVDLGKGEVEVRYRATVTGLAPAALADPIDQVRYMRPSRYCESDLIAPSIADQFDGLAGHHLVDAIRTWVNQHVAYTSGASKPTDGAASTLLSRQGVCRDFAHLVVASLRAMDVPARVVAVYAPGLEPMDFHAIAEAWVDGTWWAVDATGLAPLASMVRIATGRDAADTAFLTTIGEPVALTAMRVDASDQEAGAGADGPQLLR